MMVQLPGICARQREAGTRGNGSVFVTVTGSRFSIKVYIRVIVAGGVGVLQIAEWDINSGKCSTLRQRGGEGHTLALVYS